MDQVRRKRNPGRSVARKPATPETSEREHMFYETMPFAIGSHYIYRDDADERIDVPVTVAAGDDPSTAAKRVMVLSLITVTALALVLGLGFMVGLSLLQEAVGSGGIETITT